MVLPRQKEQVPPRLVLRPSFLPSPLLPRRKGDMNTATTARVDSQTEASLDLQRVCFHGSPLIDSIPQHISNLHIRLPPAHYYGNTFWIRDIGHHWFSLLSAATRRSAPALGCSSASHWISSPSASPPPPRGLGSFSFLSPC